jgi:hypothetical protein
MKTLIILVVLYCIISMYQVYVRKEYKDIYFLGAYLGAVVSLIATIIGVGYLFIKYLP